MKQSLPRVQERVAEALARSGGDRDVKLVAVTKGHPVEAVAAAWRAGLRIVGENRVQELAAKRTEVPTDVGVSWHLIGHLQRNKVRQAVPLSDLIHSVDSIRLAQELSKEAQRTGLSVAALVQVNVSGEETKGGFEGDGAVDRIGEVAALPGLSIMGLMTMAPFVDDEVVVRGTFRRTRELLERCVDTGVGLAGRELSMGMSGDFELAIEEGSTMIRLGTVLFGERT
ncbi:MAG TPA: YggS family pyridoxal phosphate-dependent enzyme [Longimicrobiales bacterium]|nr:YggS family pyridoxal phosphate-dependent enzyme [Longimicrobiales bacterium]